MDLKVIQSLANIGFPFAALVLSFWFATKYVWPFFTGPYQVQRHARWEKEQEASARRDKQLQKTTDEFTSYLKTSQNGLSTQITSTHESALQKIENVRAELLQAITDLSRASNDLFHANQRQIEEWRKDLAHMIQIVAISNEGE